MKRRDLDTAVKSCPPVGQADRQADRQTDRQTDRHTDRETDRKEEGEGQ